MAKTKVKIKTNSDTQTALSIKNADTAVFGAKETKLEKALRLGNDEIIARAVQDIMKRDHMQAN